MILETSGWLGWWALWRCKEIDIEMEAYVILIQYYVVEVDRVVGFLYTHVIHSFTAAHIGSLENVMKVEYDK